MADGDQRREQDSINSLHSGSLDSIRGTPQNKAPLSRIEAPQSAAKREDFSVFYASYFGLFDRPKIKQPSPDDSPKLQPQSANQTPQQQQQPRLRLIFEPDPANNFLITNPTVIFKFIRPDRFFKLTETEQIMVIDRLEEVLKKCAFNAHLISDQVVTLNVGRSNQETLDHFRKKLPKALDEAIPAPDESAVPAPDQLNSSSQDIIFQLIHIGLRFFGKSAAKTKMAAQIVEIVRVICRGKRYLKCHLELVYQYVRTKVNKVMASNLFSDQKPKPESNGYALVDYCTALLHAIIEQQSDFVVQSSNDERVPNYFYFSGYLSGILLCDKPAQQWPFNKGFAACMWFKLHEQQAQLQDHQNLPVLFNCFSSGYGGFECYFIGFKLFYRILPPLNYTPPSADSNGVLIADFSATAPGKWNFLAIEHEKPFLARAQLIAVVNDKQVVNFPMDYPNFDKNNSKLNIVSICKNMTGQLTSFLLFKDQVNNPYKFVQIQKAYEYGIGAKAQFTTLNQDIFDSKFIEKLFLMFTPQRTQNKQVYDYIDQNDGELLINCGLWSQQSRPFLAETGGLVSLLPLLESISKLIEVQNERASSVQQAQSDSALPVITGSMLVNNYLKLVLAAVSFPKYANRDQQLSAAQTKELACFYQVLLQIISKLPTQPQQVSVVNCQTIHLLADLRFELGDSQMLNEVFFVNLMNTSDFWVNSNDMEVVNEYWGFVKAIYSQNPALYNKVYPIHHLVDFMLRISDISKEGAFCCNYHKKTFQMIFMQPSDFKLTSELNRQVKQPRSNNQPVFGIRKHLEPIAAVLENVLTTGGDDILDQVQYIAKSLTVKSCPCFHLQMLQLLKVLLIDAKSDVDPVQRVNPKRDDPSKSAAQQAALSSRTSFRYRFFEVKGLQILLYLCQSAALDVKAMCIKIIDMLSTQTSLIQMRIDTDLITYLSHVVLPEQLVQQHVAKQWQNQQHILQHAICEEEDLKQLLDVPQCDDKDNQAAEQKDTATLQQFYTFQEENLEDQLIGDDQSESYEMKYKAPTAPKGKGQNKKQLFIDQDQSNDEEDQQQSDEKPILDDKFEFAPLPKPSTKKGLIIKSDDQPNSLQHIIQDNPASGKPKQRGLLSLEMTEKEMSGAARDYPSSSKDWADKFKADNKPDSANPNDEEAPKPTADVLMSRNLRGGAKKGFNFAAFAEDDDSDDGNDLVVLAAPQTQPKGKSNKITFPEDGESDGSSGKLELPQPLQSKKKVPLQMKIESDDEPPVKAVESQENKEHSLIAGGTTGTTNDVNYTEEAANKFHEFTPGFTATPDEPLQLPNSRKKVVPKFGLLIDTEEINKQFNYGGENGSLQEEEALAKLENDIQDLAKYCVEAMRRSTKQKSTFQELLEQQNLSESSEDEAKEKEEMDYNRQNKEDFMTAQAVTGIKSIEKDIIRKEREALLQPQKQLDLDHLATTFGVAQEEHRLDTDDGNDEATHSGRVERYLLNLDCDDPSQTMKTPGTQAGNETQNKMRTSKKGSRISELEHLNESDGFDLEETGDQFTQELENLYTSCLEWLLNRQPSGLFENLVIDDYDKITFKPALQILMTLVSYSNNMIRQRALQDLFMLAQWDSYCLQYQDQSQQIIANQNGQIILQYPKFHSWLLELLMPYQELIQMTNVREGKAGTQLTVMSESSRAVYDMGCKLHTLLLKNACLNPEEDGFKKVNLLTRWPALIQAQFEADKIGSEFIMLREDKPFQCSGAESQFFIQTAHGLTRALLTSLLKQLKEEAYRENPQISLTNEFYRNVVHITVQIEELILSSHQKNAEELALEFQSKMSGDVNEPLFKWLTPYLLGSGQTDGESWAEWELIEALAQALDWLLPSTQKKPKDKPKPEELSIFFKTASAIEILMYEGKPSQPSPVASASATNARPPSKVGAFFNSINHGLNQAVSTLTTQYFDSQQTQVPECTFMTALMNLICLAISQSFTKELTLTWLERLEGYVKQLLMVSEAYKNKTDQYYGSVQRKIAEQVSFAFTYLFHEVHSSGTPTAQRFSPQQADVQRSKLFQQTLKNLLIFFINIVAGSNTGPKQKEQSACKIILNSILVKEFVGNTRSEQPECLINNQDVYFLKESAFEDFPELFYQNDWKLTFFHNSVIQGIVQRQLNLKLIEQYDSRRRNFVQRIREVESKTEKAKDEILKKIQTDTLDAISQLNDQEHERKNKEALLLNSSLRERLHIKKQCMKRVQGMRGMWRQDFANQFLKASVQVTGEGTKVLMKSVPSNELVLIKDNDETNVKQLQKTLFLKIFNSQAILLNTCSSYQLLKGLVQSSQEIVSPKALPQPTKKVATSNESEQSESENEDDPDSKMSLTRQVAQPCISYVCNDQSIYVVYLKERNVLTRQPKRKEVLECRCEMLLTLENRKGTLLMTNYELIFFHDYNTGETSQAKSTIHFFNSQLANDKPFTKEVPLCFISELQKRRFIGQRNALEIFLIDGRSLLLKFESQEVRDELAKKILRQRKNKCKNLKYYTSLEPKWILKKKSLTEDWVNWKISNFDYIMQLNSLAGRSYNDLSQYPVLPWILSTYSAPKTPDLTAINAVARGGAPPGSFRDLTKNMQLLGSGVRQAEFKRKYEDFEGFIGLEDKFHCGSHYSNPGIVLHYLSRLQPYLEANVELHGKTMDHPDRVFTSLEYSFSNALNDFSDVRELIPEFYFLPELFLNNNHANFGVKQDGTRVNHVKLPPWAKQDPFKFVQIMREAIESPYVSANLHTWLDFIFGYKQRGPDAQMCLNTFSKITYQPEQPDDFDISQEPDPFLRAAYENQAYNYGQTPTQLFKQNERHPQKLSKQQALRSNLVVDLEAYLKVFKPVSGPKNAQGKQPKLLPLITKDAILKARFVDDQRIVAVTKDGFAQHFVWLPRAHDLNPTTPFSLGSDKKMIFDPHEKELGLEQLDRSLKKYDVPIHILKDGKLIVRGGFWDGRIAFCPTEGSNEPYSKLQGHSSTVTTIICDEKEAVMITGSKTGEVIIWKNSEFDYTLLNNDPKVQQAGQWVCFKKLYDHERQVSSMFMNEEMGLFATGSYDGTANLYNLQTGKLVRTFKHPQLAPIYSVFIALSPLAVCGFFSREDHLWTVYSINGTLLSDVSQLPTQQEKAQVQRNLSEDSSHIIACQVIKDCHHIDKLVYGTEKGFIIQRSLPDMIRIRKLVVATNNPVLSILVSPDRRFLHVGCGDGGLIVITERNPTTSNDKAVAKK